MDGTSEGTLAYCVISSISTLVYGNDILADACPIGNYVLYLDAISFFFLLLMFISRVKRDKVRKLGEKQVAFASARAVSGTCGFAALRHKASGWYAGWHAGW